MIKPVYEHAGITIYCGYCREILSELPKVDLVLTDPPYSDAFVEEYKFGDHVFNVIQELGGKQYVFWSATAEFPLDWSAIHIWDKKVGCGSQYERCFERNGKRECKVFSHYLINSTVAASFTGDQFTGHPSQKPKRLIESILCREPDAQTILDPFMGSGTTLVAAKQLGRKCIGIELEERYCEIAVMRLAQDVLDFGGGE